MARIKGRYTLFTRVPVALGPKGQLRAGALWGKDLALHLDYTDPFHLCCPVVPEAELGDEIIEIPGLSAENLTPLRKDRGWGSVLANLIPNFRQVARAVRGSDIVHSDGAGWAFPLSFYILPLRMLRRFRWVVVIESSFWMKPEGQRASPRQWLAHHLHEWLLGAALRRADARIFTQDGYRQFFEIEEARSLINPAVWIDEDQILPAADQTARVAALPTDELRLLFPARLVPDKGCTVVMEAVRAAEAQLAQAAAETPAITLDLIGAGPLEAECRAFAAEHDGRIKVRFLDPVAYGAPFFALLRDYHGIVLANLQHEQPRVIFDAFSQGVPVISSATSGVMDVVKPDEDTLVYDVGDAAGLAAQILSFARDPEMRTRLLAGAHDSVQGYSHLGMHRTRAAFLETILA